MIKIEDLKIGNDYILEDIELLSKENNFSLSINSKPMVNLTEDDSESEIIQLKSDNATLEFAYQAKTGGIETKFYRLSLMLDVGNC